MPELTYRYQITIPSVDNLGQPAPGYPDAVRVLLDSHELGNWTEHTARGRWVNDRGRTFYEDVVVFTIDTTAPENDWRSLIIVAEKAKQVCRQESVYVVNLGSIGRVFV